MERSGEVITYSDCKEVDCSNFSAYLSLPGYSHSYLKSQKGGVTPSFNVTDKVMIGKIVDQILTNSGQVDFGNKLYPVAKKIAAKIKEKFEPVLIHLKPQVAFTGIAQYQSFQMPVKGILDYFLPKYCVLDLKYTEEKNVDGLINYMGYKNQLWNYAKLAKVNRAFIIYYSSHKYNQKEPCRIKEIPVHEPCNPFWKNAILDFGEVSQ